MGVGTRWWRRTDDGPAAEVWGGPDDVTLAPPAPRRPPDADPPTVAPDTTDDDRAEDQRLATEKAERENADREKAERDAAAEEKAAQEKAEREKAERDAAEEKAAQEKAAQEKEREAAEQERVEREAEERRVAEAAAAQTAAEEAEREETERRNAERAKVEQEQAGREAEERAAQERIDAERRAVEREAVAARETVPAAEVPGPAAVARDPEAGARERRRRRRRVLIVFLVAALLVAAVWVVPRLVSAALSLGASDGPPAPSAEAAEQVPAPVRPAAPPPRPELPRGGSQFFPSFRVVAYYGTPDNPRMGVLGSGSPEEMSTRLETAAAPFASAGRTVLPAMELIVHVADGAPGPDGNYSHAIDEAQAWRYLAVARAHRQLLVLDLQPGSTDFLTTARPWERILREPDVGLALDPEWRMPPGQVPGQQIGTVAADEINQTSAWLAEIVRTSNVPQKLFVVHQFTPNMITNPERLTTPPELAVVQHVDGFGAPSNKIAKYQQLVRPGHLLHGFKLFYTQDTPMLTPQQTLGLTPNPDFVTYQ